MSGAGRGGLKGGFGLGLAVVRAIAEAHHGSVHVRSTAGYGSEFELVLPASNSHPGFALPQTGHVLPR